MGSEGVPASSQLRRGERWAIRTLPAITLQVDRDGIGNKEPVRSGVVEELGKRGELAAESRDKGLQHRNAANCGYFGNRDAHANELRFNRTTGVLGRN